MLNLINSKPQKECRKFRNAEILILFQSLLVERQMISVGDSISKKNSTSGFTWPQILSPRFLTTVWLKFPIRNSLFKMKCQIFGIDSLLNFIYLRRHKESRNFRNAEIVFFISSRFLRSCFSTNDRLWYVGLWCVFP